MTKHNTGRATRMQDSPDASIRNSSKVPVPEPETATLTAPTEFTVEPKKGSEDGTNERTDTSDSEEREAEA